MPPNLIFYQVKEETRLVI